MFITFEGGEGSGKSSLISYLFDLLTKEGQNVLCTRAPGGTVVGEKIREILLHCSESRLNAKTELLLYLADFAQFVEEIIKPHLEKGGIVLCDRFTDSSMAYQGASRGLNFDVVEPLATFATGGLLPDLTIYLDVKPEIGLKRAKVQSTKYDRLENEALAFHEAVRKGYLELLKRYPNRMVKIDASKKQELVFDTCYKLLKEHMK